MRRATTCFFVLALLGTSVPLFADSISLEAVSGDPLDSTRTIKFVNNEKLDAGDLHILFTQATTVTTKDVNDRSDINAPTIHNIYGIDIAHNFDETLSFQSAGLNLTIKDWWWTRGGDATKDGDRLGEIKHDSGGTELSFLGPPATGDGALLVQINGASNTFTTTAGFTAAQEAAALDLFLSGLQVSGFALINVTMPAATTDDFVGNILGDPALELAVSVLHEDSTQAVLLAPFPPVAEPGTFLLLGGGIGLIGAVKRFGSNFLH